MMKWGMEILSPTTFSNWSFDEGMITKWTPEENKLFENALAVYDKDTPDRWQMVAAMIPGKTVIDVIKQYQELEDDLSDIEAGLIPIPGYTTSSFTLEWVNNHGGLEGLKHSYGYGTKRTSSSRTDQERKKGVPWTEDEHKLFLLGLNKYGKGDWRNISRNFVTSRTPTQVASHAQKFFIRQLSGGKDKRRPSIHDITTVDLANAMHSPDDDIASLDQTSMLQPNEGGTPKSHFDWNQSNDRTAMVFSATHGNLFVPAPYGVASPYGMKLQGQNLQRTTLHGSHVRPQSTVFRCIPYSANLMDKAELF